MRVGPERGKPPKRTILPQNENGIYIFPASQLCVLITKYLTQAVREEKAASLPDRVKRVLGSPSRLVSGAMRARVEKEGLADQPDRPGPP